MSRECATKTAMSAPNRKRVLFVGLTHSVQDSRLNRFLAREIRNRYPSVECLYLGRDSDAPPFTTQDNFTVVPMPVGINPKKRRFRFDDAAAIARHIQALGADLVQISDPRELPIGFQLKLQTCIPVVFDSHEDYFNQSWEYGGKSLKGLFHGVWARTLEAANVRFMDAVFCTDPFLEGFYRRPIFQSPPVTLVRNIPPSETIHDAPVFHDRTALKLIYVGSINRLRGLIETADYCARFNGETEDVRQGITLSFHVYSRPHEITDRLASQGKLLHHGFATGAALENAVRDGDIGVSLIRPSIKFRRNILIKNFEYMAAGLPILTSNYGTMAEYVGAANAGVLCDPLSYEDFMASILRLRDPEFRKTCGENGLAFAKQSFHRNTEVRPYLETVGRLLNLPAETAEADISR